MLKLGATSFWEEFDPAKQGNAHLAMYGRPFGKSLCHAWGASPIYLPGKYFLGVKPTSAGYASWLAEPALGGLKWMEGTVPTPNGEIKIYCSTTEIRIRGSEGTGILKIKSSSRPVCKGAVIRSLTGNSYEIEIMKAKEYLVKYKL
ncbi:alpha-L-rhamnosidase C-terminal domain-containing protein [Pedobacter hartonius]|uniref:Alpha-L-rhamnosidase n=1 Tax=Pedobacter hartonius TaxID=425514 RepID=A0A1H4B164_9SPHI|nr:hypothetical protein [Pedobacter hartonius]SEA41880.1 alpha-L-rhamnosidase [Pedobacter hartonius]